MSYKIKNIEEFQYDYHLNDDKDKLFTCKDMVDAIMFGQDIVFDSTDDYYTQVIDFIEALKNEE